MSCIEITVWAAVRGYHIYKDSCVSTVGEEFVCYQERTNEHDRHTVTLYRDSSDVLGHLPRAFSREAQRETVSLETKDRMPFLSGKLLE